MYQCVCVNIPKRLPASVWCRFIMKRKLENESSLSCGYRTHAPNSTDGTGILDYTSMLLANACLEFWKMSDFVFVSCPLSVLFWSLMKQINYFSYCSLFLFCHVYGLCSVLICTIRGFATYEDFEVYSLPSIRLEKKDGTILNTALLYLLILLL